MTRIPASVDRPMPVREAPDSPPHSQGSNTTRTASSLDPASYTKSFIDFISNNPTVYHAVSHFGRQLESSGFTRLSERDLWSNKLKAGGRYYFTRNGSGLIAFAVGEKFQVGSGIAMVASHVDALTAKLKPISTKTTRNGYQQVGVAQYGGALNQTWLDRDLGIGGRVFVKDDSGKISTRLVKLDWPVARIPTLAPHFGVPAEGQPNRETRMIPIIGVDNSDLAEQSSAESGPVGEAHSFVATQPPRLVRTITDALALSSPGAIQGWDLELFDFQPAQLGGLGKELLFAGRTDDKMCSYAAIEALLQASSSLKDSSTIQLAGLFDAEEIGSLLRQGARSNFLPSTIERIVDAFASSESSSTSFVARGHQGGQTGLLYQTYANSFLLSADVCHAHNPNYDDAYLEQHKPRLNVGVTVAWDSNAHMTTDGASALLLKRVAERSGCTLQTFQIRNDSRSGGTVGPMLSAAMGVRAIDAGIPQLSMHSIRATTGALDPGLGVKLFAGFFEDYETVDEELREG